MENPRGATPICAFCQKDFKRDTTPNITQCCCQFICDQCLQKSRELKLCRFCCGRFSLESTEDYVSSCLHNCNDCANCERHNKPAAYFCEDCSIVLCDDCIFEQVTQKDRQHEGHKLRKISEIAADAIPKLTEAREILRRALFRSSKLIKKADRSTDLLSVGSEAVMMQMHNSFRSLLDRMKRPFEKKEAEVTESMAQLIDMATASRKCVDDASKFLECEDTDVATPALMGTIHDIDELKKSINDFQLSSIEFPDVTDEMEPQFESFDFDIPNFVEQMEKYKAMNKEEDRFIYSSPSRLHSVKWRLKVFPAGNLSGFRTHVSAFLELLEGIKGSVNIVYQVEILDRHDHTKQFKKSYQSEFELCDSWGWNKLISLQAVTSYLSTDGTLSLRVNVRPEGFRDAVKIQEYQNQEGAAHLAKLKKAYAAEKIRMAQDTSV